MAIRAWITLLLTATVISALTGCGGGATANVQNAPPPLASNVSIAFQLAPEASIFINVTETLTAVVSNDPTNAGVDWSLTCPRAVTCGSLSALHTDSGATIAYTPPASLAGNSQTVDIVAFATADHTQNVLAPITVVAFGSNLKGNYVLQAQGVDSSFEPYQFAGVIVMDGNGGITSGEQTVNFFDQNAGFLLTKADAITGGSYFLGPDGRGTITISTADQDVGLNGIETFSFVFLSSSQALIAQTDVLESGTGTMDLQTATAAPLGGYAFVVSGTDIATVSPMAFGGIINIDSPNTISGAGSVTDQNLAGTVTAYKSLSGAVSDPDSFGAVALNLSVPDFPTATTYQFTGYIVDATHIKLIESDNTSGSGSGATGGLAIGQGSATGTFKDDSAFAGTYVSGVLGVDLDIFTPASFTSVSLFSADGSGGVANGVMDTFFQGNGALGTAGAQISEQFGGTYSVDAKGTGRVRSNFSHFTPPLIPAFRPLFFFYLTGNGNPPLVLDGGDQSFTLSYPSVGAGIAYPQSTAPLTFGGKYGFGFTQQNGSESDGTGQMTADPTNGSLSSVVDINSGFNPSFNNSFSDRFDPPLSNGRFAGTLFDSAIAVEYYIIDPSHGFVVETDLVNPGTGQVSFGYYATRNPVCTGCQ